MKKTIETKFMCHVDLLYKTFSKYPCSSSMQGCPCCVKEHHKNSLTSKPLRDLLPEDIDHYSFKAMTTWGNVNNYKHFLPRILEITTQRETLVDTFVVFGKLERAQWQQWPENERNALIELIDAWWAYDLNFGPYFDDELFTEIALFKSSLPPLNIWSLEMTHESMTKFIGFLRDYLIDFVNHKGIFSKKLEPFIDEVPQQLKWIDSQIPFLENAFFHFSEHKKDLAKEISDTLYTYGKVLKD